MMNRMERGHPVEPAPVPRVSSGSVRWVSLLLIALAISVLISSIAVRWEYLHVYAGPTAAYGIEVMRHGQTLPPDQLVDKGHPAYLDLMAEYVYPIPSVLVAEFLLVLGIAPSFAPTIPIFATQEIAFILLAFAFVRQSKHPFSIGILALLVVTNRYVTGLSGLTVGRAGVGLGFVSLFVVILLIGFRQTTGMQSSLNLVILLFITILAAAFSYYTAVLAIVLALLGLFVAAILFRYQNDSVLLAGGTLALALFLIPPLHIPGSGNSLVQNLLASFGVILRQDVRSGGGVIHFVQSPLLELLTVWSGRLLLLATVVAGVGMIVWGRPKRKGDTPSSFWLLSSAIFLIALSEIAYLKVGVVRNSRILQWLGLLLPLPFLALLKNRPMRIGLCWVVGLLLVAHIAGSGWYAVEFSQQGGAHFFALHEALPSADFLLSHSEVGEGPGITGDSNYLSWMQVRGADVDRLPDTRGVQLGAEIEAFLPNGSGICQFAQWASNRDVSLIAIESRAPTAWGDEWGPGVNGDVLRGLTPKFSSIWDDGGITLSLVPVTCR